MAYQARTAGTPRPTRNLNKEVPLGILAPDRWHDVRIIKISTSAQSVRVTVADDHEDSLTTQLYLRQFNEPSQISERLKVLLAATAQSPTDLTTMAEEIMAGDHQILGELVGRKLRVKVGIQNNEPEVVQLQPFSKPSKGGFPF